MAGATELTSAGAAAAPPPGLAGAGAAASPAPDRRQRLANYATLGLLTLIWGTTWAAIRVGLRGVPPFTGVALRFAIAAAALAAAARGLGVSLRGAPASARQRANAGAAASAAIPAARGAAAAAAAARPSSPWRVWLANGLLTFFIPYGVLYWAEQWVPSGLAAVLFATSPLWVALAAHLALPAERLRAATAAGILIGFAGVAVIFSEDLRALGGPRVAGAAALLLVSPLTSAFGVVAVKRWSDGMHPLAIVTAPMAMAAAGMGCLALAGESGRPPQLSGLPLAALLYLALIGTALAFALYFWLLGRLPATTLSLINYLTPIVALLIGSVALGEPITGRILAGSALVVGGVAVAMRVRAAKIP
ncbi:MAG: DMT family transporter [Acidobacteria bacterium]|nr:DMT family transporter [Acidobacteriota bacterium]